MEGKVPTLTVNPDKKETSAFPKDYPSLDYNTPEGTKQSTDTVKHFLKVKRRTKKSVNMSKVTTVPQKPDNLDIYEILCKVYKVHLEAQENLQIVDAAFIAHKAPGYHKKVV